QRQSLGRFHHQRVAVLSSGLKIVARKIVADDAAEVARLVRRNSAHLNHVRSVGIGNHDIGERDACLIELVAQSLGGPLAVGGDRFVHRDLQNQVCTTLKVQSAMDILLDCGKRAAGAHGCPASIKIRTEEDAVSKDQQNCDDKDCFSEKIFTHDELSLNSN